MVHGDDFTALGVAAGLETSEQGMAEYFEIKLRGRVSEDPEDLQEIKILNRIVRVDHVGLH